LKSLLANCAVLYILCLLPHFVAAQSADWDADPRIHQIPDSLQNLSAVIVSDDRKLQFHSDKNDQVFFFRTSHRIVKVLDDLGIESFNKITLSADKDGAMILIKARTISPEGKVTEIAPDDIRQSGGDDGAPQYSVAFENVEKQSELELFYIEKKPFSAFGSEYINFGLPMLSASFTFEAPKNLQFQFKGYNGFPVPSALTVGDITTYRAVARNIPDVEEEVYSSFRKNLMRIEYKLDGVEGINSNLYNWDMLADKLRKIYYNHSEKELRQVRKFLESKGYSKEGSIEERITRIETIIKTNIAYNEEMRADDYSKIAYILEKKTTGEDGFINLFAAAWKVADIPNELGLTSNYFVHPVDREFENWSPLEIYLFYFPDTKKYMAPSFLTLRYPMIPLVACHNTGIFSALVGKDQAVADLRNIPGLPQQDNGSSFKTRITFGQDGFLPMLSSVNSFEGYSAFSLREAFVYINKEKEKDLVQSLIFNAAKPEDIISYKINNTGLQHYTDNAPLEIFSETKAAQLLERAGNRLLFKVGEVIGPQEEMYEEKERKLPITLDYPHTLHRSITIEIPQGYTVKNPEAVNIDIQYEPDAIGFVSKYTMEGNKMIIDINEYYGKISYPVSEIEQFRKVINAAADFNKITLVMEQQ